MIMPMSPLQSWTLLGAIAIVVVLIVQLIVRLDVPQINEDVEDIAPDADVLGLPMAPPASIGQVLLTTASFRRRITGYIQTESSRR